MTRLARRQLERLGDAGATRPNHHLRRQLLECLRVLRTARVAASDVCLLELAPGAELSGTQQRHEVVELAEIVLEWRRGEEEDVVALDLLEKLVAGGVLVLDLVCLVDDDEVPPVPQDLAAVLHGYGAVVGHGRAPRVFPVRGVGWRVELLEEFALP